MRAAARFPRPALGPSGARQPGAAAAARGHIRTASYAQVAEPIYRAPPAAGSAIATQMAPVLPILAPWAERMGYASRVSQLQRAVAFVDLDRLAVRDLAAQDRVGERVLEIFLDRALQRPRAVDRIVADPAEPGAGAVGELEHDLAVLEQLLDVGDLDVDDRAHMLLARAGGTG